MAFNREEFIRKARRAGKSDEEISQFLKNKGHAGLQGLEKGQNIFGKLTKFFATPIRRAFQFGRGAKRARRQEYGEAPAMESYRLAKQAQQAKGVERQKLLEQSRAAAGTAETYRPEVKVREWMGLPAKKEISPTPARALNQWWENVQLAAPTYGKAAANLASLMFPAGTAGAGIPVTKGLGVAAGREFWPSVARGALAGLGTGALGGYALSEEGKGLKGAAIGAGVGGVTGGVLGGSFNFLSQAWDFLTNRMPASARAVRLDIDVEQAKKTLEGIDDLNINNAPREYKKMKGWAWDLSNKAEDRLQKILPEQWNISQLFPDKAEREVATNVMRQVGRESFEALNPDDARFIAKLANELDEVFISGKGGEIVKPNGVIDTQDLLRAKRILEQSHAVSRTYGEAAAAISATSTQAKRRLADRFRAALRGNVGMEEKGLKIAISADEIGQLLDFQALGSQVASTAEEASEKLSQRAGRLGSMDIYGPMMSIAGLLAGGPQWAMPGIVTTAYRQAIPQARVQQFLYGLGRGAEQRLTPQVTSRLREFLTKGVTTAAGRGL
ncbi:hypothetical protein AKJ59_00580 [candidate division MSBL1 archaeon SCGC-AAA385M02]|uniref:Uncharacterized protein n=1 Tax=candidate division MSBL1 archaeon SCGC-AAA385M02 TaxID=1698287 RepID=A0A133VQL1_9EURY|nr:hypothetical protein AKJ59_00580 [candidate division MSBL1 archaeon SCGC-AAA385M02]